MPDRPWLAGLPHDDTYWEVRTARAEAEVERLRAAIREHRDTVQSGEEPWEPTADERLWACLDT